MCIRDSIHTIHTIHPLTTTPIRTILLLWLHRHSPQSTLSREALSQPLSKPLQHQRTIIGTTVTSLTVTTLTSRNALVVGKRLCQHPLLSNKWRIKSCIQI